MSLLDDPVFKTRYQKYKHRVKRWESDFIEKFGRKPNKTDIKQADIKIKEAYKVYWNLKTRALEDSLNDIAFSDDSFQCNESILQESLNNSTTFTETPTKQFDDTINESNLDVSALNDTKSFTFNESTNDSCSNFEIENEPNNLINDVKNVAGVWSKSLNLKKNDETKSFGQRSLARKSSSFQLSQKMFKSSSFVKRNPRKMLSSSKLPKAADKKMDKDEANMTREDIDDSMNEKNLSDEFLDAALDIDMKINITSNKDLSCPQIVTGIKQIMDNQRSSLVGLNRGWLQRCSTDIKDIKSTVTSTPTETVSDEEDFIYDSDEDNPKKRIRNFRKHFSYGDLQEPKRMRTDDLFLRQSESLPNTKLSETLYNILKTNSAEAMKTAIETEKSVIETDSFNQTNVQKLAEVKMPVIPEVKAVLDVASVSVEEQKAGGNEKGKEVVENLKNVETVESVMKKANTRKQRVNKVKDDDEDNDDDWQNDDDDKDDDFDNNVKRKRKATKKDENKEKVTRKPRANAVRKSTRVTKKAIVEFDAEAEEEQAGVPKKDDVNINTFEIDNVNTVARFALDPVSCGSLIEDFSRVLTCDSKESVEKSSHQKTKAMPRGKLTDKEKLEKKIASGTVNDNFVRINLKKKVYVRGKRNFNYSTYKKNLWKQRKKDLESSESNLEALDFLDKQGTAANYCFKCKETGHFAKYCPNMKKDKLLSAEEVESMQLPSSFPTLEEAAQMARTSAQINFSKMAPRKIADNENEDEIYEDWDEWEDEENAEEESQPVKEICKVPEELIEKLLPPEKNAVPPFYSLKSDNTLIATPAEVFETLRQFGHESFRTGQERAVMRILSGVSTLVTLATGTGKSLCYQLPALMFAKRYNCITLVVSPLVSLMDDQVKGICSILKAACLHTNQTEKVRQEVMQSVRKGNIDVLLVSPEAIVAGEKSSGFGAIIRDLPPIAFACIDEAHCISQWSHNFRPSYLMLCRVLKEKLKVKVILGLTATATKTNALSIVEHLGIPDGLEGVVTDRPLPDNLQLTISRDMDRDNALIELIKSPRLQDCESILVYCTRREECVRIAGLLRTVLQNASERAQNTKKRISPIAEAYHAGFSAYQRKLVQKAFMNGDTRIIVATIAFGMGINKPDIRCVIHYNMPSNFENYVQEIGRAGRDGLPAQCHLFLNADENNDKMELRRHIFANAVERHTIRKLLEKLFVPCSCLTELQKSCGQRCSGHEVALPNNDTVEQLDTNEEIISTLLCYLELHPRNYITVLSSAYVMAKVATYGGSRALKLAAQNSPPLAMAIAMKLKDGTYKEDDSMIEFNVIEIGSNIGWDSGIVKSHLKGLEWITVNGATKRSPVTVSFHTLGIRVRAPGDLSETELDEAFNSLFQRSKSQEVTRVAQLNSICDIVRKYSVNTVQECSNITEEITQKSEQFKDEIRNYFVNDDQILDTSKQENIPASKEAQILRDIRALVCNYRETSFTGRTIARIFYGIQSPNYPARIWFKCRYWRAHLDVDFNYLCQLATQELFAMR